MLKGNPLIKKPDLQNSPELKTSPGKKSHILIVVAIGTFMSALDSSIVNISLPKISSYFSVNITTVEWVILSYLLIISSLLLTYGRLGDLYGHNRIYKLGFIIFTTGSVLCALSSSIILLILFRGLQAVGAGMLMAMGPAIITLNVPVRERGRSLGIIAISVSIALTIGPVIGGLLTSYFGWQSIFLINIPIGIAAFIWSYKVIPYTKIKESVPFDYAGALLLFLALVCIIFPLSYADKVGWVNPIIIVFLVAGVIFLLLFIIIERKLKHPMFDFSLFKNRLFSMGNLSLLFNFMAQFLLTLLIPFYLIELRHMQESIAGLILIASPIIVMIVAPIAGYISDRVDTRYLSSGGMAITTIGLFLMSTIKSDTKILIIIIYLIVIGFGIGTFQTPNNSAIMGAVPASRCGVASSMLAAMRNLGMVLGITLSGTIFSSRYNYLKRILPKEGLSGVALNNGAFIGAMQLTLIVATFLAVLAVFASLVRGPLNKKNNQI